MIPYGRQDVTQADIEAVVDVLKSDYLTQGPVVPRFEAAIARYCGVKHAAAANSATSALHLACLALGLGAGDWLWTTPITFVASANCALYCGARVDFVDIDPFTWNINTAALESKLVEAARCGRLPKVLVAVHLCGRSCDMRTISALSQKFGFRVIEDASHAIGGSYDLKPIGSCQYSDVAIFSFHPVKTITSGEGGMAVTNDDGLARSLALLRSHGITREASEMTRDPDGEWYYQQIALGYNYRMTELHGALGLSQFHRLDTYVAQRHALADRYDLLLADLPVTRPAPDIGGYSGLHLYAIRLKVDQIASSHEDVFRGMRTSGIGVNLHYIPVHLQPYYQRLGFKAGDFPEAEKYYSEAITLPMYPKLSCSDQDQVVDALKKAIAS